MKTRTLTTMVSLLLALATPAWAVPQVVLPADFTGSCDVASGCLVATPTWSTQNATVSWVLTPPANQQVPWHYSYTFAAGDGGDLLKEVSHLLLEISPSITDANLAAIFPGLTGVDPDLVESWGDEGGSSPGIPGLLYGLKFTDGGATVTWEFDAFRNPIWGDFYSKDGRHNGADVYAFNAGFGTDPASPALGSTAWVPTPDTVDPRVGPDPQQNPVPGPASVMLVGLGILAVAGWRRVLHSA